MKDFYGYLPVSRKLFEHDLWLEKRPFSKFEAWVDLLAMANFEDKEKTKIIGLKVLKWGRGQLPASIRFLQERWNWGSTKRVKLFLDLLQNEHMIEVSKETGQNIITICKYDTYNQKSELGKREGNATGNGKETRGKREGNETNKGNKGNKENNDNRDTQIPLGFEDRWEKFAKWFKAQEFQYVVKIQKQLVPLELQKLLTLTTATVIQTKLLAIENAGNKYAKNVSVYLTLNTWINNDNNG